MPVVQSAPNESPRWNEIDCGGYERIQTYTTAPPPLTFPPHHLRLYPEHPRH